MLCAGAEGSNPGACRPPSISLTLPCSDMQNPTMPRLGQPCFAWAPTDRTWFHACLTPFSSFSLHIPVLFPSLAMVGHAQARHTMISLALHCTAMPFHVKPCRAGVLDSNQKVCLPPFLPFSSLPKPDHAAPCPNTALFQPLLARINQASPRQTRTRQALTCVLRERPRLERGMYAFRPFCTLPKTSPERHCLTTLCPVRTRRARTRCALRGRR